MTMVEQLQPSAVPSSDQRWRLVEAAARRHGANPDALIETLHAVQEAFGYIDERAMRYVAALLRVPLSKVYGVSTFYHFFHLHPPGRHCCIVCLGTACYIKGASSCLQAVEEAYHVKSGQTTPDGRVSVLTARCVGTCGLAPLAIVDGQIIANLKGSEALSQIRSLLDHDT